MPEILVVDDERFVREDLKETLEGEGYNVRLANNGEDALEKFRDASPDLILLDIMMPGRNGYAICEEIRSLDPHIPVIFLTGLESEANEIRGMSVGGDDYIIKGSPKEVMLARVRRSLERNRMRSQAKHEVSEVLNLGRTAIDFTARCARFEDGTIERLTGCELGILRALATNRSRYFSPKEIAALMHGEQYAIEPTTLRSQISRLKTKLGQSGELIVSVRFVGYKLRE